MLSSSIDLLSLLPKVENTLKEQLARYEKDSFFFRAANHTLLNPGKRLRPLLTLATTLSLGGEVEAAFIPAAAIEILHTYSLIHDDLPAMDNDAMRRGKPTLHTLYGEGQAVLVGDLLLTLAFEVLAKGENLSSDKTLSLIKVLAERGGGSGMILGQSIDLASEGKALSFAELSNMHKRKTGDLISASLEFGGIIAGASPKELTTLKEIGNAIGLSFQIIDDVLDVEGEQSLIGKPLHSDESLQKSTSVSLLGLQRAKELADELLQKALKECVELGMQDSPLQELLPRLIYRKY